MVSGNSSFSKSVVLEVLSILPLSFLQSSTVTYLTSIYKSLPLG